MKRVLVLALFLGGCAGGPAPLDLSKVVPIINQVHVLNGNLLQVSAGLCALPVVATVPQAQAGCAALPIAQGIHAVIGAQLAAPIVTPPPTPAGK